MSRSSRCAAVHFGLILGLSLLLFPAVTGLAEGPEIVFRSPAPGEELGVGSPIELTFDRAMDRAAVEAAFSVSPDVAGRFEWIDGTTVRFHADAGWQRDTEFLVSLSTAATTEDGVPLDEPYAFRFRSVGYLAVTQTVPVADSKGVAVDSTIFVMFNRPVVPLTALSDPGYGELPTPIVVEPAVAGAGEWLNTSVYLFTPSAPLRGGTTYTVTVPAGTTDTTGGVVAEDVSWAFTTERPRIVWTSPDDGAELVRIDRPGPAREIRLR